MRRKFVLPIKGLSINNTYTKQYGMTALAREWFATVEHVMSKVDNANKMKELRESFDPLKNAYAFQIRAFVPKEFYYTKDGKLSRRSFDCSNFEKSILDVMCLDKYTNSLRTDDCVVKSLHSTKLPSEDGSWRIEVTIRIIKN